MAHPTLTQAPIRLTEPLLFHALENHIGYCVSCRAEHDGCEPDATRHRCENLSAIPDALSRSRGALSTRRAVAQRRSRASGLTRPLAEAIRGF